MLTIYDQIHALRAELTSYALSRSERKQIESELANLISAQVERDHVSEAQVEPPD